MMLRTGIAILVFLIAPLFAQSPAFEVASIKTVRIPAGAFSFESPFAVTAPRISGNRVTVSGSLSSLIRSAYNVKGNQVLGAPDWATVPRGDTYDVVAKTEGDGAASLEQVRLMLQGLLAERFQLKFHRDMKALPLYELVIGRNGSKLKESAPDVRPSARITSGPLTRLTMTGKSTDDLAQMLSTMADRPVVDKTGLKGLYDFTLEVESSASNPMSSSVLTAVQEQLGLKLNPVNEPTEVLVIDHAEKPSAN
jgi:uncharacterized protein (TIGR03435 family)